MGLSCAAVCLLRMDEPLLNSNWHEFQLSVGYLVSVIVFPYLDGKELEPFLRSPMQSPAPFIFWNTIKFSHWMFSKSLFCESGLFVPEMVPWIFSLATACFNFLLLVTPGSSASISCSLYYGGQTHQWIYLQTVKALLVIGLEQKNLAISNGMPR